MSGPQDQFKINLNQNLWGLVVGLGALGSAEYFNLGVTFWLALVTACIMLISVICTTTAYTITYFKNKTK